MKLKSFFKRFFVGGEVIEVVNSPINGEIKVIEDLFGKKQMLIGGVTQSGGLVEKLWEAVLPLVQSSKFPLRLSEASKVQSCLILGLGCGDAARIISEKWPEAKITGIEIDPKVIEIGKKHFGLDKIPKLKIITNDAIKIILNSKFLILNSRYDLILVDLYLSKEFPKEAENEIFLEKLKNILSKKGIIIFNRLYYNSGHRDSANKFLEKVRRIFPVVVTKKLFTNIIIFASFEPQNKI